MKASLYLLGAMAVAAGTVVQAATSGMGTRIEPRNYLQPQIDAMTSASSVIQDVLREMTAWNGDNWNHLNTICSKNDDCATKLYAAATSFQSIPEISDEEEEWLTPSATALHHSLLDYAHFMKKQREQVAEVEG